jgi:hypothetical protein
MRSTIGARIMIPFARATTKITPMNETAFSRNADPAPAAAIGRPARPGPTARAKLNSMPLSADAAGRSSFLTSSGKTARQLGDSKASPADNAKASSGSGQTDPVRVSAANIRATPTIQLSVYRINLRRSTMSPMAPAGSAKMKNGKAEAVCVSATYIGPALSETISPAAPTLLHERANVRHNAREE